jgi:hypothetical protein
MAYMLEVKPKGIHRVAAGSSGGMVAKADLGYIGKGKTCLAGSR